MSKDDILISPEEVKRRRSSVQEESALDNVGAENEKEYKFFNRSGKIEIKYETEGRFGTPTSLYFKDYTVDDMTDLSMSKQENLLETTMCILNKNKLEDENTEFDLTDMLMEEFIETLIGLKIYVQESALHTHPWVCECQSNKRDEEHIVNETEVNLLQIGYKSVTEADESMRAYVKEKLSALTKEQWLEYTKKKYSDHPTIDPETHTIDDEVASVRIKEPVTLEDGSGNVYEFRFLRVKDFLVAQKITEDEYNPQYKMIKNKKYPGMPLAESKALQENEIAKLKHKQAKEIALLVRALGLVSVNGKSVTPSKALEIYKNIPLRVLTQYLDFTSKIEFGVHHELNLDCPLCGETRVRWLQQGIIPYEFLPLSTNTKRELRQSEGVKIYFAV